MSNVLGGKWLKLKEHVTVSNQNLLEIIHTDICGPLPIHTLNRHHYSFLSWMITPAMDTSIFFVIKQCSLYL